MTLDPSANSLHVRIKQQREGASSFILDVDLQIPSVGVTALFGPSGSGKTTLLRCISGLEKSSKGHISLNGEAWQTSKSPLPSHKRPIGYVFQDANLFPHLTAQENLQLDEVIRLADYMVVLEKGSVIEEGKTQTLLGKLGTSFSQYQDASVVISGVVTRQETEWGLSWIRFENQVIAVKQGNEKRGDTLRLRIRSKDVSLSLSKHDDSSILNRLTVKIDGMVTDTKDPSMIMIRLLAGDTPILARITTLSAHKLKLQKGQTVIAQIKSVALLR